MQQVIKYSFILLFLFSACKGIQPIAEPKKENTTRTGEEIIRDNLARKCLGSYQFSQSLTDSTGKVTFEAMKKFEELFAPNTRILNDLEKDPVMINYKDYSSNVFSFLRNEGVDASIVFYYEYGKQGGEALQESIEPEKEFYVYTFPVKRKLMNGLDEFNNRVWFPGGRLLDCEIVIIASSITNEAKILSIRPRGGHIKN